jgi:hypothetical protein
MPSKEIARSSLPPGSARKDSADRRKPDTDDRLRHNQRARDNQRTSRARRKELLNDLQRRVDEYERRGVQATLEMQQAARRVARENARLRALLLSKGVTEPEVEMWLSQDLEAVDGRLSLARLATAAGGAQSLQSTSRVPVTAMLNEQSPATPASTYPSGPLSTYSSTSRDGSSRTSQTSVPLDETNSSTSSGSQHGSRETGPSLAERVASCCTSGNETSCEVAAAILANMQGHGDTSRARVALGCEGPSDCTVKNTRVLELLDEAG